MSLLQNDIPRLNIYFSKQKMRQCNVLVFDLRLHFLVKIRSCDCPSPLDMWLAHSVNLRAHIGWNFTLEMMREKPGLNYRRFYLILKTCGSGFVKIRATVRVHCMRYHVIALIFNLTLFIQNLVAGNKDMWTPHGWNHAWWRHQMESFSA